VQQPRASYLAFKLFSKEELQIAWPCAKLIGLWMSTDGKVAPNHPHKHFPWKFGLPIQYRLTKINGVPQNCPRDKYLNKLPVVEQS
jgi:hypothetical protein